jgi:hypothetical protein
MVRTQRVGMRVRANQCGYGYVKGDTGTISRADGDDCPEVELDDGRLVFITDYKLTEIKESGMTLKEAIDSGRRWKRKGWPNWKTLKNCISMDTGQAIENDFEIEPIPKVKEVTMADLEEKYGCKVKVVK